MHLPNIGTHLNPQLEEAEKEWIEASNHSEFSQRRVRLQLLNERLVNQEFQCTQEIAGKAKLLQSRVCLSIGKNELTNILELDSFKQRNACLGCASKCLEFAMLYGLPETVAEARQLQAKTNLEVGRLRSDISFTVHGIDEKKASLECAKKSLQLAVENGSLGVAFNAKCLQTQVDSELSRLS